MRRRPRSRHACWIRSGHASRQPRRAAEHAWAVPLAYGEPELGELPDLEDLGPAVGTRALNSRTPVLHRDLLRILDLDLLAFLDAVALRHRGPPFEPIPRATLEHLSDARARIATVSAKSN